MQCIQLDGLDRLIDRVDTLIKRTPKLKRDMLEEMGRSVQGTVAANIAAAGFADGGQYLRSVQRAYVGSKGGYVAVRAVGSKEGYAPGPNSPGAITNYNEHGHTIPRQHTEQRTGYRYRPRIKTLRVDGRHFYWQSGDAAEQAAQVAVDRFAQRVVAELEGRT